MNKTTTSEIATPRTENASFWVNGSDEVVGAEISREIEAELITTKDLLASAIANLLKYGRHKPECGIFNDIQTDGCDCGWQKLKKDVGL